MKQKDDGVHSAYLKGSTSSKCGAIGSPIVSVSGMTVERQDRGEAAGASRLLGHDGRRLHSVTNKDFSGESR